MVWGPTNNVEDDENIYTWIGRSARQFIIRSVLETLLPLGGQTMTVACWVGSETPTFVFSFDPIALLRGKLLSHVYSAN